MEWSAALILTTRKKEQHERLPLMIIYKYKIFGLISYSAITKNILHHKSNSKFFCLNTVLHSRVLSITKAETQTSSFFCKYKLLTLFSIYIQIFSFRIFDSWITFLLCFMTNQFFLKLSSTTYINFSSLKISSIYVPLIFLITYFSNIESRRGFLISSKLFWSLR